MQAPALLKRALVVLAALLLAAPAQAQRSLYVTLVNSAKEEYDKGHYKESLRLSQKAKEIAVASNLNGLDLAVVNLNLAENSSMLGKFADAERLFKEALTNLEDSKKLLSDSGILIYNDYAALNLKLGHFSEAEGQLKSATEIADRLHGRISAGSALVANNLLNLYISWGKIDKAKPLLTEVAKILALPKSRNTIAVPFGYFNIANFAMTVGKYNEAEKCFNLAIDSGKAVLGEQHTHMALLYRGFASLRAKQYRFADADNLLTKALEIDTAAMGKEHVNTARDMILKADALCDLGKYDEAREMAQNALEIAKQFLGSENNIECAEAHTALGRIDAHLGNYTVAENYLKDGLAVEKEVLGPCNIRTVAIMRRLAIAEADQGNCKEAIKQIEQARANLTETLPENHPELIATAKDAGYIYLRAGLLEEAQKSLSAAADKAVTTFGEDNPLTLGIVRDLASLEFSRKNYQSAESRLKSVIEKEDKNEANTMLAADLTQLALVLKAEGKDGEALPLLSRAGKLTEKLPGASPRLEPVNPSLTGQESPVTDKWALLIGVSNFKDPSINLKYAAKDATDFANFLKQKEGFKADHVKVLLDGNATRQGIIDNMGDKWLGRLAAPSDLVIIYVSSHGSTSQEDASGVNFLVAYDTNKNSLISTGIPMQWFSKMIKEQVHAKRVLLILDVCHSAAAGGGDKAIGRSSVISIEPEKFLAGEGQMVICSSAKDQVSWESVNYQNSVFTRRLIDAMAPRGTTVTDAFSHLKDDVQLEVLRDRGQLQTPIIWASKWSGAAPVLSAEPTAPRPGL